MASSNFNSRPSTPINWADDDEDDFDFDAWKATVDNSTPTVQELGPLQATRADGEENSFSLSVCKVVNEPTARVATKDQAIYTDGLREEPQESAATTTTAPEAADSDWTPSEEQIYEWQCTQAREWLLKLALKKVPDVPAYPEVSMYSDGTPSPDVRIDYVRNWNYMKSLRVKDSRSVVYQYRSSRLRQVSFAYDEDSELEDIEEADEEFSEVVLDVVRDWQLEPSSEEEVDEALTPPTSSPIPILHAKDHESHELAETDPHSTWNGDSEVDKIETMPLERPKVNPLRRHRVDSPPADDEQVMRFSGWDSPSDTEFDFGDIFDGTFDERSSVMDDDGSRSLTAARHPVALRRCFSLGSFELPIRSRPLDGVSTSRLEPTRTTAIDDAANSDNSTNSNHGSSSEPPQQDEATQLDSDFPEVVQTDGVFSNLDLVSPHSKRDESHEVESTSASLTPQPSPALRVPAHSPLLSAGPNGESKGTRQAEISLTNAPSQSPSSNTPTPTSPQVPASSGASEKTADLSQNSWPSLSSMRPSWTTIGAFAAGVVVGSLFNVACRRYSR